VTFNKQAPKWGAIGIEPPESKRNTGWEVEDRPPAAWLNWFMNLTAESLEELQTKAVEKTYVEDKIAEAISSMDIDIPDASLTQKGIVQLSSATDGTRESVAATENVVKTVNDSLVAHKADNVSHVRYAPDTGTANAKVITLNPAPTAYVEGMGVSFKNLVLNTGAVTINVNGLGAKAILKSNGGTIASGNLKANSIYTLRYNDTAFILQGEGGEYGTAVASQVRAGTTIGTESGIVAGTLAVQATGAQTVTPTGSNIVKSAGIYDGPITVAGVVVPVANLKVGSTVAGQAGTMPVIGADTLAGAISPTSGRLYMRPSAGYWNGAVFTYYDDANFVAAKIPSGTSIFGLAGSRIDPAPVAKYLAKNTIAALTPSSNRTVPGPAGGIRIMGFYVRFYGSANGESLIAAHRTSDGGVTNSVEINTSSTLQAGLADTTIAIYNVGGYNQNCEYSASGY
jgi:hypothetical protein